MSDSFGLVPLATRGEDLPTSQSIQGKCQCGVGGPDQSGDGLDEDAAAAGHKNSLACGGDRQWLLGRGPGMKKNLLPNWVRANKSVLGSKTPQYRQRSVLIHHSGWRVPAPSRSRWTQS